MTEFERLSSLKFSFESRYYEGDHNREEDKEAGSAKGSGDAELVRDIVMENAPCPGSASALSLSAEAALEAKRERLMRKVELAKQGWTGVAVTAGPEPSQSQSESKAEGADDLDTTPYEEIDEDEEEEEGDGADQTVLRRPPVGELPSFIPLSRDSGDEDGGDEAAVADSLSSAAKDDSVVAANEEEFEERLI